MSFFEIRELHSKEGLRTNWFFDFGRSEKLVGNIYSHIGKHVNYKGVCLHI